MHKRKLTLLTFISALMLFFCVGCSDKLSYLPQYVVEGNLNITDTLINKEVIKLDGQWEFYWNMLLEPKDFSENSFITEYINVPGSWNKYIVDNKEISGDGYATYRLLLTANENERLGIKIPRIFTSYNLFINGDFVASAGKVGKSLNAMTPQYLPQIALFKSKHGVNEIIIQVSNFYHRSGGILESIKLGSEDLILDMQYKSISLELFLFGSLLIMGMYHLFLFIFRTKNTSPLYFGLFCLLVSIRTLLTGERFFIYLFPNFDWEVAHKIQTMSFYLGVPIFTTFFMSVFTKYFNLKLIRTIQIIGIAFCLLILLTPARIFTVVNPVYQVFTLVVIAYFITTFLKIASMKEKDVWLIIVGGLALILTSLNDIIFLSVWMNDYNIPVLRTVFRTGNLSSTGQLIFVFANSLMLAKRFSKSIKNEEVMTSQLKEVNLHLDSLVKTRTEALNASKKKIELQKMELEQANQKLQLISLKDPLTGLWNRRYYDETIKNEWLRCLRNKKPISMLLIDVDYFKEYNDFYGHKKGDECLEQIAHTVNNLFKSSSDTVARYGGEEFVIIIESNKDEAIKIANILRKNIEDMNISHQLSSVSPWVTASIGVTSTIPNDKFSYKEFFLTVDKALYQAKDAGRNQVKFLPS